MACLTAWLLVGSAVFVIHLHRSVMGRQGYADWSRRAADLGVAADDKARALATADFELAVALKAEPWIWPSVALGMVAPVLTAGVWLARRGPTQASSRTRR